MLLVVPLLVLVSLLSEVLLSDDVEVDAVDAVDVAAEVDNCEIRSCNADASPPGPPLPDVADVADVPLTDEVLSELDDESLLPCDCKADIRLCRKLPMACAASDDALVLLLESVLEVDAVLPVLLPELLESPVTPIDCKASAIAPIKPPPPPRGGGGGMLPMPLVPSLPPDWLDWVALSWDR